MFYSLYDFDVRKHPNYGHDLDNKSSPQFTVTLS